MFRTYQTRVSGFLTLLAFTCGLGTTGCGVVPAASQSYESSQISTFEVAPGRYQSFLLGRPLSQAEVTAMASAQTDQLVSCKHRLFGFCIIASERGNESDEEKPNNRRFKLPDINMKKICQGSVIVAGAGGALFLVSGIASASGLIFINPISFAAGITGMKVSATVAAAAAATAWATCRGSETEQEPEAVQ